MRGPLGWFLRLWGGAAAEAPGSASISDGLAYGGEEGLSVATVLADARAYDAGLGVTRAGAALGLASPYVATVTDMRAAP